MKTERERREAVSFIGNTSTLALIDVVLLAVITVAGEQIAERVDTIVFTAMFPLFGMMVAATMELIGVLAYGWVGGMVVGNINPIVAIVTATGPLAPLWFLTNTAYVTGARVVRYYGFKRRFEELNYRQMLTIALGGMLLNVIVMTIAQLFYFRLPWPLVALLIPAELAAGSIVPALLARKIADPLIQLRRGVL